MARRTATAPRRWLLARRRDGVPTAGAPRRSRRRRSRRRRSRRRRRRRFLGSLGTLAVQGHDAFFRQALVGGNYGLLDARADLAPNPGLFVALLWGSLVGDVVLAASVFVRTRRAHQDGRDVG